MESNKTILDIKSENVITKNSKNNLSKLDVFREQKIYKKENKTIIDAIMLDKKSEIHYLLTEKNCKKRIITSLNVLKYGFLVTSSVLIFVSGNIDSPSNRQKTISLVAGSLNILMISSDKIIYSCESMIKRIKKKINELVKSYNEKYYDI